MIIGISKGFGLNTIIIQKIGSYIPTSETKLKYFLEVANKLILSLNSGLLSILGLIIMIYSAINVLMILEESFNKVWGVKNSRNLSRIIVNYVALIFMIPIIIMLVIFTNESIVEYLAFSSFFINIFKILVYTSVLTIMYYAMPNTNVSFKLSLISAILVEVILWVFSYFYTIVQISISSYNAIYGSLAFIPLFLLWVKYFWIVILLGAQLSRTLAYPNKNEKIDLSIKNEKILCVFILNLMLKKFINNEKMYTKNEIIEYIDIDSRYISKALNKLEEMEYINKITDDENIYYQINKNPDNIDIKEFLEKYENSYNSNIFIETNIDEVKKIINILEFKEDIKIKNI